jgi:hypothetical protein
MEAWLFQMKPWMIYRPEVADSHHFEEGLDQDPDPDPR